MYCKKKLKSIATVEKAIKKRKQEKQKMQRIITEGDWKFNLITTML